MDTFDAIKKRISVREYADKPVEKEKLEKIVDAGHLAPTAKGEEPWEFIIVTKKEKLKELADITDHGKFLAGAAAGIAIFCKDTKYYLEDGCVACENMLLAAADLGVASCWVAGDKKFYCPDIAHTLGVPENLKLISMISLGYPKTPPVPHKKRPLKEVLHWEKFLVFVAIFLTAATALATEFSGDIVQTSKAGVVNQKFFISGDKSRMEAAGGIAIIRPDKKVMWMLMPQQKMYMEQPLNPSDVPPSSEKYPGEIERTLMGKETVDGRMTEKYRVVYTAAGIKTTVFQWFAPDLGIPVKTAAEDGSWTMEYKNIKMGSQPASLFEIPAGYSKMEMPSMDDMPVDIEY